MRGSGCCGCCGWGRRRYFEQQVDGGPEGVKGQSADHGFLYAQQLAIGTQSADDEGRCATDLHPGRVSQALLNGIGEFPTRHALLDVDTQPGGARVDVTGIQRGRSANKLSCISQSLPCSGFEIGVFDDRQGRARSASERLACHIQGVRDFDLRRHTAASHARRFILVDRPGLVGAAVISIARMPGRMTTS
jgi:hypothetical protein